MGKMGTLARLVRAAALTAVAAVLLGVPLAASANPDVSGFELDGNAAGGGGADWDALGSPLEFTGFLADPTGSSDRGYTGGGSKDTNDISQWRWEDGQVEPAKDNIAHAYAAVYAESGNLILYFGQNRVPEQRGDANVGFWFLQSSVGLNADGTFSGTHADGDLLVQSEFTNGGVVSGVHIYKWQSGSLQLVSDQAECSGGKLGTANACAIVNTGTISTSWAGSIPAPYFFEGGINLTGVFGSQVPCFSTFLTNTRTSQSESAQLKDFALGAIDTCGSITIRKEATPSDGTQFGYITTGGLSPSSFSLTAGGSRTYAKLQPGSYSVTEDAPSGSWAFDSLSCSASGPGTSASTSGRQASITLGFLGAVECTYVNKRKPQVKVVKALVPSSDSGTFDLQINGTTYADDVGNDGTTGFRDVTPGEVTVAELAGAGTSLGDYDASVSCDSGKGSASGTSHTFSVSYGDQVTCTITNSRKPEVKVVKATDPETDPGKFNLLVNGNVERANATNGQDTGFVQVGVGTVTVGESAGTGTDLGNYLSRIACDSGKGSADPATSYSFSAGYGDRVTCTITNTRKATLTVIKHVINDNGGTKRASDFPIQVTGNGPSPASFAGAEAPGTVVSLGPGAYSVTESEDTGYAASYSAGCSGTIPAGGSATCTITNDDKPATLTVIKTVVNDDGGTAAPGDFTITITGVTAQGGNSFPGAGAPGVTRTLTTVGAYAVSESSIPGYTQTSASADCSGTIALGESKTCTIVNEDRPGTLVVVKHVVNNNGGTAAAGAWTMNVAGPTPLSFAGAESPGTTNEVVAGAYKVTESGGPAGYALSYSGDCDADGDVTVPLGETRTCVLTNDDQPATLIVKKVVVNDDGGTKTAGDFSFSVNGGTAVAFESDGENVLAVAPGTYTVTEPAVSGYETSYDDCTGIELGLGGTATCTITNDDKPAHLKLVKVVTNDDGGTAAASAWTLTATGPSTLSGQGGAEGDVDAGTYALSESGGPAGYDASAWVCVGGSQEGSSLTLGLGESATCTITNDDRPAHLKLVKVVTNDNGGTASASDWLLSASGRSTLSGQGGAEGDVDAGTYTLSESGGPAGYDASAWVCVGGSQEGSSLTLGLGESATCTITNDDQAPKLTLVKEVVNDDGGTATASAWTLTATGPTSLSGPGPSVSSGASFDQGTYTLSESGGPAGYDASAWDCGEAQLDGSTLVIGLGDEVTCTIVNDDRPATLIVKKVVVNDNGGTKTAGDFSFQVNGGTPVAFEPDGQNDLTVAAGTYDVTELGVAGYTTNYSGCADIVLALGGTATCTITNDDVPRGVGSISVSKSASPSALKEPGGQVTYSVTVTNTSLDVAVTIGDVSDDRFGDLDDEGGKGYVDVPFTLPPGGSKSFQFTAQVTGAGGTTHVNVVTASGRDASGNPVSASDDARVAISERLIDLVVVKDATSPTPLNGTVTYTLSVTNKGPDTATNVQLADPAPAGITYLSATASQGSCSVSASVVTCALGTLAPGQTVTVTVTGRATQVGQHTNTATVTGGGGRETNPADNVDSALTVVPAPLRPPTSKPQPKPEPEVCLALTVSPKMVKADGKPDKVTVKVTAGTKPAKGVRVVVSGAGVKKVARTNGKGIAVFRINPRKAGIITITALETKQQVCGPKRIGVVGVFLPPLTG